MKTDVLSRNELEDWTRTVGAAVLQKVGEEGVQATWKRLASERLRSSYETLGRHVQTSKASYEKVPSVRATAVRDLLPLVAREDGTTYYDLLKDVASEFADGILAQEVQARSELRDSLEEAHLPEGANLTVADVTAFLRARVGAAEALEFWETTTSTLEKRLLLAAEEAPL